MWGFVSLPETSGVIFAKGQAALESEGELFVAAVGRSEDRSCPAPCADGNNPGDDSAPAQRAGVD